MSKRKAISKKRERKIEVSEVKAMLIAAFLYEYGTPAAVVMASYIEGKMKK